eukprot:1195281-Prorocentrum_minimum.AAC.5
MLSRSQKHCTVDLLALFGAAALRGWLSDQADTCPRATSQVALLDGHPRSCRGTRVTPFKLSWGILRLGIRATKARESPRFTGDLTGASGSGLVELSLKSMIMMIVAKGREIALADTMLWLPSLERLDRHQARPMAWRDGEASWLRRVMSGTHG